MYTIAKKNVTTRNKLDKRYARCGENYKISLNDSR